MRNHGTVLVLQAVVTQAESLGVLAKEKDAFDVAAQLFDRLIFR